MRKSILAFALFVLCVAFAAAQAPAHSGSHRYSGSIMDSTCAGNGNHNAGYKLTNTTTPKDCTLACVQSGAKFVLYNAKTHTTYQLDDQTQPKQFAGEHVRVTGTLDPSTKTIHVTKISKS